MNVVTFTGWAPRPPSERRCSGSGRNRSEAFQALLRAFQGRTLPGVRRRGESPSEALTRPLRGVCGPLPGTKVRRHGVGAPDRRSMDPRRAGIEARGRREARGAGVSTERSAAERASTRRPEESLSAWSQEPARTRGRPAPQRRSAVTRTPQGRRLPGACDGHGSDRGSRTRARRGAKRTEGSGRNRQRVRKRHRHRM